MSTRSVIARTTEREGGFKGVYCHSDGYPQWMGPALWKMLHEQFRDDLASMLRYLIDQHPAGWSTLGEECYCHPKRKRAPEAAEVFSDETVEGSDVAWLWVFDEEANRLFVRDFRYKEDAGIVELAGEEPDWLKLECGENLERCSHCVWVHFPEMKNSNLSTTTYLGRQAFALRDAVAFIVDGHRYTATGSGGHSDYLRRTSRLSESLRRKIGRHAVWISSVKTGNGRYVDIPVAYVKNNEYTPFHGVTWVFPPIRDNPAETLVSEETLVSA